MTHARHIAAALLALACASCASYRVGPTPAAADNSEVEQPAGPVAVETVATPAEWAMNGARLTRTLVDQLVAVGVAADWTDAEGASTTVHCSADGPPPTAFEANRAAHVDLRCRIDAPDAERTVVSTRGTAAAGAPTGPGDGPGQAASTVMQEATADALERAAPRIADALAANASDSERQASTE